MVTTMAWTSGVLGPWSPSLKVGTAFLGLHSFFSADFSIYSGLTLRIHLIGPGGIDWGSLGVFGKLEWQQACPGWTELLEETLALAQPGLKETPRSPGP